MDGLFTDGLCAGAVICELLGSSFQSLAAENWKERQPKEELALGVTSEIYLLERVLR